jgi:hypothetical protein
MFCLIESTPSLHYRIQSVNVMHIEEFNLQGYVVV